MSGGADMPEQPDYMALQKQQGEINKEAAFEQTVANRPNQVSQYGRLNWTRDPKTGQWTQTQSYNPQYQALNNAEIGFQHELMGTAGGMLGGIKDSMGRPLDFSGMTTPEAWQSMPLPGEGMRDYGNIDMSGATPWMDPGFGAVEQVQEAMMGRLAPLRQGMRDTEINRLKAQGITEGTPAWQAAMSTLSQGDVDASQQALLGAMGAYGDIFERGTQQRAQQFDEQFRTAGFEDDQRAQQFKEQLGIFDAANKGQVLERAAGMEDYGRQLNEMMTARGQPLADYASLMSLSAPPDLNFGNFMGATGYTPSDMYGAAMDQYGDLVERTNAANKQRSGMYSGIGTIAGGIIGGMFGMPMVGMAAGGALGGMV